MKLDVQNPGRPIIRLHDFDHAELTGYTLDGKHQKIECKACHAPAELTDGQTTPLWRLGYRECRDCHKNPHAEGSK